MEAVLNSQYVCDDSVALSRPFVHDPILELRLHGFFAFSNNPGQLADTVDVPPFLAFSVTFSRPVNLVIFNCYRFEPNVYWPRSDGILSAYDSTGALLVAVPALYSAVSGIIPDNTWIVSAAAQIDSVEFVPGQGDYLGCGGVTFAVNPLPRVRVKIRPAPGELPVVAPSAASQRDTTVRLTISLEDSTGARVGRRKVSLRLAVQEGTGGHLHSGGKPYGQLLGGILRPDSTVEVTTDDDGHATLTFVAPVASGAVRVIGESQNARPDTLALTAAITGLVPLTPGGDLDTIGTNLAHPVNNYGTPATVAAVRALADSLSAQANYLARLPAGKRHSGRFPTILLVNDVSLPSGGVFDIHAVTGDPRNAWAPPHVTHRLGRDADIDVQRSHEDDDYAEYVRTVWQDQFHQTITDERDLGNHLHLNYR